MCDSIRRNIVYLLLTLSYSNKSFDTDSKAWLFRKLKRAGKRQYVSVGV